MHSSPPLPFNHILNMWLSQQPNRPRALAREHRPLLPSRSSAQRHGPAPPHTTQPSAPLLSGRTCPAADLAGAQGSSTSRSMGRRAGRLMAYLQQGRPRCRCPLSGCPALHRGETAGSSDSLEGGRPDPHWLDKVGNAHTEREGVLTTNNNALCHCTHTVMGCALSLPPPLSSEREHAQMMNI